MLLCDDDPIGREIGGEILAAVGLAVHTAVDGLDAVRGIVKDAPRFMAPGGLLVVEVGHGRAAVESAYPRMPFVWLETEGHDDAVFAIPREDIVAGR